jgi:hypothetical protein
MSSTRQIEILKSELRLDNKTFVEMRSELTKKYYDMWVTIFEGTIVSVRKTYDESARKAKEKFGEKTLVTRQVVPEEEGGYWILRSMKPLWMVAEDTENVKYLEGRC